MRNEGNVENKNGLNNMKDLNQLSVVVPFILSLGFRNLSCRRASISLLLSCDALESRSLHGSCFHPNNPKLSPLGLSGSSGDPSPNFILWPGEHAVS